MTTEGLNAPDKYKIFQGLDFCSSNEGVQQQCP